MKKGKLLYKVVHSIGAIVRTALLTNAFEYYFDNLMFSYITNAAVGEVLLWQTTYHISVGNIYVKYSNPAWGSFLYTVFYIINNFLLILSCNICKLLSLDLIGILIVYLALLFGEVKLVDTVKELMLDVSN